MSAYEIPANRWVFKLAPQLSGKAQQAYAALAADAAADYTQLKEAILARYDVNQETYRQRFRAAKLKTGETTRELCVRLGDLVTKWTKDCDLVEALRDLMVMEQLVGTMAKDVRVWVTEHKPDSSARAAHLADDYLQARKQSGLMSVEDTQGKDGLQIQCHRCKKRGHRARDCCVSLESKDPQRPEKSKRDLKDITCFNWDITQLIVLVEQTCYALRGEVISVVDRNWWRVRSVRNIQAGKIEGRHVSDVCLDTGCSRSMV